MQHPNKVAIAAAVLLAAAALQARADAVIDWNTKANDFIVESKLGTPPAMRAMAIVQTAVYEAVKNAAPGASLDAAVAAANRVALAKLLPAQHAAIDAAWHAAITRLPEDSARSAGIQAGQKAANEVLAARADDGAGKPVAYRPTAFAGMYVPTAATAVPHWGTRKPWHMKDSAAFRPAPPPALESAEWARDYNETKALGGKSSMKRTPEQSDIAQFWEYSLPSIYHGVIKSVAAAPGRTALQNARLYAAATQALDDALIAVFEAKYQYNYWRPITAVRNGDIDGNPATERDAAWTPFIDAPMHPEYPSGHAILAGALGAVIDAELAGQQAPVLSTTSPSAKHATRQWKTTQAFVQEVAEARIYAGMHFRSAVETAADMGRQIGKLAYNSVR